MLDRILYQRLDGQNRDLRRQHRVVDIELTAQLRPEAQFFDFQIRAYDPELLCQWTHARVDAERVSKQTSEIQDQPARGGIFTGDHPVQCIQRVKEEVRIDLSLQRAEFRLRNERLHFGTANTLHLL